jgi:hypothetical protein
MVTHHSVDDLLETLGFAEEVPSDKPECPDTDKNPHKPDAGTPADPEPGRTPNGPPHEGAV